MTFLLRSWQGTFALLLCLLALERLPLLATGASTPFTAGGTIAILLLIAVGALASFMRISRGARALILFVTAHTAAWLLIGGISGNEGDARLSYFLLIAASWLLGWRCISELADIRPPSRQTMMALRLLIPAIFGAWVLILWEAITRGAGVPFILLPPPSAIWDRIVSSVPILAADVRQTILKAVLFGYVVGCAAGFAVAILADRISFLRRGLLPIGNLMSALPIIGVAPIMVMWFGFDWQSKAAVVIVMTFFPMLVNTVAGLGASGSMERDLLRSYAAGYWQRLV